MANVYYLKMNQKSQVDNHEFIEPVPKNYPNLQPGDLCFVRLQDEYKPSAIKRLWEFVSFVDNSDGSRTAKFKPRWSDLKGHEIFFNRLELAKQFSALKLFQFDIAMGNYIHKQQIGKSFIQLTLINSKEFYDVTKSFNDFNNYIAYHKNYRQVEVVDNFDLNSENIQLTKNASGEYDINHTSHIGKSVLDRFDGKRPNQYAASSPNSRQLSTPIGKMYQHLENGTGDYSMVGFYDLFCSQVDTTASSTSKAQIAHDVSDTITSVVAVTDDGTAITIGYDFDDASILSGGENLIIYGTPGCGKSHELNNRLALIPDDYKLRVTFYQDYTYTDFVGQVLPVVDDDDKVKYEFVPGPFSLALRKAINNKDKKIALIIEEINRGNAASIFGDLFQLLDRNHNGASVYPLTNIQIVNYLKKFAYTLNYIKIPANLSIYATMNTGDQNVFTLDTAFKRRWKFEKISNKFHSSDTHKDKCIPGMNDVTWENFVCTINEYMIKDGTFDSEDKQLGKYFVTENQLVDNGEDDSNKTSQFAYKVLEYLWNDVAKFDRERWFNITDYNTLDVVIEAWKNNKGKSVFNSNITFATTPKSVIPASSADESGEKE